MSHNTYLFVQEKDVLLSDTKTLCAYTAAIIEGKPTPDVPFASIKVRLCHTLHKYQEQPALLDSLIQPLVVPVMSTIQSYVRLRFSFKGGAGKGEALEGVLGQKLDEAVPETVHDLLSVIYFLAKTRGFKFITKFFPHEVADLEAVIVLLVNQMINSPERWESKYILLLWLSIIILVPFNLDTIDSALVSSAFRIALDRFAAIPANANHLSPQILRRDVQTLHEAVTELCKHYLNSTTITREAAALCLAKFFTRPDIQKTTALADYFNWAVSMISRFRTEHLHSFFVTGCYNSLVELFAIGQRQDLLPHIQALMPLLEATQKGGNESITVRLLRTKLAQRVALTYLRPRVPKWLYSRGSRSLLSNIKKSTVALYSNVGEEAAQRHAEEKSTAMVEEKPKAANDFDDDEVYFDDVNGDHLESLIDFLLKSLGDRDTVVRWSAAKGVGRITYRLSFEMADDVTSSLLEQFKSINDGAWHGGCLAIAELARRGLLLPARLPAVFPILYKALAFDQSQGSYSVGAHVRDAACYVAWAFARAYEPELLAPFVTDLAQHLLIVTLFDREVNCRRAASAAFQEHVGRQGNFPQGIAILTEADYFTVGVRNNAYLNVSIFVGSFQEYFSAFVDHLAQIKLKHWEPEMRKLTAATLSHFSVIDPKYLVFKTLPSLLPLCTSEALHIRHGALYGIGEILLGVSGNSSLHNFHDVMKDSVFLRTLTKNERLLVRAGEHLTAFKAKFEVDRTQNSIHLLDAGLINSIAEIFVKIEKAKLYRGKGGEVTRASVCRLIECIGISGLALESSATKVLLDTLDESLRNPLEEVQIAAVRALGTFSERYHTEPTEEVNAFVTKLLKSASKDPVAFVTRGYTQALATISSVLVAANIDAILQVLGENVKVKPKTSDDADTRRFAVQAVNKVAAKLGEKHLTQLILDRCFELCFTAMNDYTTDKRGDIGSVTRESAMYSLASLVRLVGSLRTSRPDLTISVQSGQRMITLLLQQLCEKIDRTRLVAGSLIQELFDHQNATLPEIPHKGELAEAFSRARIKELVKAELTTVEKSFQFDENLRSISVQDASMLNILDDQTFELVYHWNIPHSVYPFVVRFLELEAYAYNIFKGLIVSIGGLTESIVKYSLMALNNFIKEIAGKPNAETVLISILQHANRIMKEHHNSERLIVPLFKTLEFILGREEFAAIQGVQNVITEMTELVSKEMENCKSIMRLTASTGTVVCLLGLAKDKEVSKKLLDMAARLLFDKEFPKVRKALADKFYLILVAQTEDHGAITTTVAERISDFLCETDWLNLSQDEIPATKEAYENLFLE
eukprot:TRINITY_DN225_c0_g1_i1.p1 TRINITY_DN225_c0_g1~~TRINITY_DN225_c0_g1_i1.p1  ORF type:complete len:1315 (-),score=325.44 TRINITY_DN225_c0_g1_i1:153-4097(-)